MFSCHVLHVRIECFVIALAFARYSELSNYNTAYVNYTLKNNCTLLRGILVVARLEKCIELMGIIPFVYLEFHAKN